ncbi:MAG: biopolymer transporter ExbD [Cyanobacteria bacterium P01_H01_bin.121]
MRLLDDEPDQPPQVNIVPMIDAIFAILAFFIISTLFLTRLEGLPVSLPRASTAAPQQEAERVTLTIQADGSLFLDQDPVELAGIEAALQAFLTDQSEVVVIVN